MKKKMIYAKYDSEVICAFISYTGMYFAIRSIWNQIVNNVKN